MAALAIAALLAGAATLPLLAPSRADAAGPAVISVDVDPLTPGVQQSVQIPEGTDPIEVDIVVQNANAIGAFEFETTFESVSLQFQSWVIGPFLGSTGRQAQCIPLITENTIRIGCTTNGPPPPDGPSGDGVLMRLFFHPRFTGTICFALLLVETAEIFGHPLPTLPGGISCVSIVPNTPTPTATATPTAVPTASRTPAASVTASRTVSPSSTAFPSATISTTASPSVTASSTASPSVTVAPTLTPAGSPEPSTSPGATTSPNATGTSHPPGTAAPQPSHTSQSIVLSSGGTATPSGGGTSVLGAASGLPRTGARVALQTSPTGWIITAMGLTIGVLLVLLLRQIAFGNRERDRIE